MNTGAIGKVLSGPAGWALVLGVGGLVIWLLHDKLVKDAQAAANLAGGIASGNNALTAGTAYEGAGVAGTLGAAANSVSGGLLAKTGSWLSGFFDPNADYDPNADAPITPVILQSRKQAIADNYYDQGVLQ